MSKENKKEAWIRLFGLTVFITGIWMVISMLRWNWSMILWQIVSVVFFYLLSVILVFLGIIYFLFGWGE